MIETAEPSTSGSLTGASLEMALARIIIIRLLTHPHRHDDQRLIAVGDVFCGAVVGRKGCE